MPISPRTTVLLILLASALIATLPATAQRNRDMPNPDLTRGESIPEGSTFDLTLGATGLRGWMHSRRLSTTEARQVAVTRVDAGSPADGLIEVGDVLLGVAGKPFSHDPRVELGNALTHAESNTGGGKLTLTRWRGGETKNVVLELEVLGDYSPTAPYECEKSARILELGSKALAARIAKPDYKDNPISRSLNALALLATGNPDYLPLLKKEAEWAAKYRADAMATWYYGYVVMFLAEYHMITQDDVVLPGLRRLALEAAEGQSIVGSWGHKFAGDDGRLVGYGMMNAPGLPLTSGLVMARMAGVEDPKIDLAIERSLRMQQFHIGKGAVPYGDHAPWMDHEDNGKCAMAAVLFNLQQEKEGAEFFSRMSFEQIKPLLPAIHDAVVNPAPSGIMFADGSRLNGLHVLADHGIREGMALCFAFIDIDRWNKHQRVPGCMDALAKYGASAAPVLPQLRQLEKDLAAHPEIERNQGLASGLKKARAIIQTIESGEPTVELRSLGEL